MTTTRSEKQVQKHEKCHFSSEFVSFFLRFPTSNCFFFLRIYIFLTTDVKKFQILKHFLGSHIFLIFLSFSSHSSDLFFLLRMLKKHKNWFHLFLNNRLLMIMTLISEHLYVSLKTVETNVKVSSLISDVFNVPDKIIFQPQKKKVS